MAWGRPDRNISELAAVIQTQSKLCLIKPVVQQRVCLAERLSYFPPLFDFLLSRGLLGLIPYSPLPSAHHPPLSSFHRTRVKVVAVQQTALCKHAALDIYQRDILLPFNC